MDCEDCKTDARQTTPDGHNKDKLSEDNRNQEFKKLEFPNEK